MDTIFINSENTKTSGPDRLLLNLSDKVNLKRSDKYVALSNLSIYYSWKNISQTTIINLKYQLRRNEEYDLPRRSYSVSDAQDYFKYT